MDKAHGTNVEKNKHKCRPEVPRAEGVGKEDKSNEPGGDVFPVEIVLRGSGHWTCVLR